MIFWASFSRVMNPLHGYRSVGVASAAGAEALPKAPRSVITFNLSIIYRKFLKKLGAKITLYPY